MRRFLLLFLPAVLLAGCSAAIEGIQNRGDRKGLENLKDRLAPVFAKTDAEREQFIAQHTAGYEPLGEPIERSLQAFEPVRFSAQRGECLVLAVRLEPGAAFSEQARYGLGFMLSEPSGTTQMRPGVFGTGGVADAGCSFGPTSMAFTMKTFLLSRGHASSEDLGNGPVEVQLHRKTLSEEEIAAIEAQAVGCALCKQAYEACVGSGRGQEVCDVEADDCVGALAGQVFKEECW